MCMQGVHDRFDMPGTTIRIDLEVRNQLRARGRMGESYNDVIRRLLAATRPPESARGGLPDQVATGPSRVWVPGKDRD